MKKKINRQLLLISSMAVIITLILVVSVFYRLFQQQVIDDLKTYAHVLASIENQEEGEQVSYGSSVEDVRITIINAKGIVVYDSNASVEEMDNHAERPEVVEALENGEGQSIRQSSTMKMNTYYYTILLNDGNVLRVARESHSIWSIIYNALPVILVTLLVLFVVCVGLSRFITKSLVGPIEEMAADMDHMENVSVYEELVPFAETIQQQHEAILKNANMRQEFTANVSHELKTPLAAISGYSELIESGMASGEDVVRFASGIHQSANRLLVLINDIIRLSELDVMDQEVPFETISLYDIARDSVDMLQVRAENRSVILTMEGNPCNILGDRQMIEELIYNLCDNAICYNNVGGSVHVIVEMRNGHPVLEVKDTGIGIPEKHQERIFERFYRVDKSRSKSTGGTGLGLAIVKHIVAVHNATIELKSEVGKGTDITITFQELSSDTVSSPKDAE
ncbi:MAG: two-component sensor histidine kinase [Lachnospiraceae bacterium]|nr:two-component sensor histidine kinase [Lachnospiraceae bacterium]